MATKKSKPEKKLPAKKSSSKTKSLKSSAKSAKKKSSAAKPARSKKLLKKSAKRSAPAKSSAKKSKLASIKKKSVSSKTKKTATKKSATGRSPLKKKVSVIAKKTIAKKKVVRKKVSSKPPAKVVKSESKKATKKKIKSDTATGLAKKSSTTSKPTSALKRKRVATKSRAQAAKPVSKTVRGKSDDTRRKKSPVQDTGRKLSASSRKVVKRDKDSSSVDSAKRGRKESERVSSDGIRIARVVKAKHQVVPAVFSAQGKLIKKPKPGQSVLYGYMLDGKPKIFRSKAIMPQVYSKRTYDAVVSALKESPDAKNVILYTSIAKPKAVAYVSPKGTKVYALRITPFSSSTDLNQALFSSGVFQRHLQAFHRKMSKTERIKRSRAMILKLDRKFSKEYMLTGNSINNSLNELVIKQSGAAFGKNFKGVGYTVELSHPKLKQTLIAHGSVDRMTELKKSISTALRFRLADRNWRFTSLVNLQEFADDALEEHGEEAAERIMEVGFARKPVEKLHPLISEYEGMQTVPITKTNAPVIRVKLYGIRKKD